MRTGGGATWLEPESEFAGYVLDRRVGSGSTSEIWAAAHPRLPRIDALKILHPPLARLAPYRRRFLAEAEIAAGLDHPAIVPVYDRGCVKRPGGPGVPWIAMKMIAGCDAERFVVENGPMPATDVVATVRRIAAALDYAHGHGVLHRDVRPRNILLAGGRPRSACLADFGVARTAHPAVGGEASGLGRVTKSPLRASTAR